MVVFWWFLFVPFVLGLHPSAWKGVHCPCYQSSPPKMSILTPGAPNFDLHTICLLPQCMREHQQPTFSHLQKNLFLMAAFASSQTSQIIATRLVLGWERGVNSKFFGIPYDPPLHCISLESGRAIHEIFYFTMENIYFFNHTFFLYFF